MSSLKERLAYELSLLSKLVAIDTSTTPKNNWKLVRLLSAEAHRIGLKTKIVACKKDRPNLVMELNADNNNKSKERLLVAAHYDTVPAGDGWKKPPFRLTLKGGRAYGRGTCDDKGAVVAALGALRQLKEKSKVNVSLLVTCDEETNGELGLGTALRKVKGTAGVVLDSNTKSVGVGACGVIWGKIAIKGVQGHAAFPYKFRNAIDLPFMKELSDYSRIVARKKSKLRTHSGKRVWGRFSITMVHAGEKENIIPGECELRFDLRTLPEENMGSGAREFRRYFEKTRKKHGTNATLHMTEALRGYHFPSDGIFTKAFAKSASAASGGRDIKTAAELFGNDGYFFRRHNIPAVCFGPLNRSAHARDEFVLLSDIEFTKRALVGVCMAGW